MDKNEFFRESTIRICGNLEIEEGLFEFLKYLQGIMPVTRMYLERWDETAQSTRTIAIVTEKEGQKVDRLTPLSAKAEQWASGYLKPKSQKVFLYDNPLDRPLASEMMRFHKIDLSSVILLPLETNEQIIGSLILGTEADNTFKEEHADLIALLSEPLAIAMSNSLKYRDEIKMFERNFFWEVTMRVCGNLDIEKGLGACREYLAQHMPADALYLEKYDPNMSAMCPIARAYPDKAEVLNMMIPLTKEDAEGTDQLGEAWGNGDLPSDFVFTANDCSKVPVARGLLDALGEPSESSIMSLPLFMGNQVVGALVVLAEGTDRFTEHHAGLLATVREPFHLAISNTLKHNEIIQLKELLADDNRFLHNELHRLSGDEIVGANFGLKHVMHKVQQVASLDSPVLLLGKTGVGKDVMANYIHYSSSRSNGPFVSVNCGAIPESLIDSELFGYEKGAFTGALAQKRGRFERADKGTIFLDEIGELPPQAQIRFLRVLQDREIERVGGTKTISLDIRIIAATNRDLEEMVKNGDFREDLWFRLNVFPVTIPPLRERTIDIPALLQHFIESKSKEMKLPAIPEVAPGAIDNLMAYPWPGNVRELQNVVERALILNPKGPLTFEHMEIPKTQSSEGQTRHGEIAALDEMISQHIQKALIQTEGKVHGKGGAAELLEINANTLRNRMNKLGIKYKKSN